MAMREPAKLTYVGSIPTCIFCGGMPMAEQSVLKPDGCQFDSDPPHQGSKVKSAHSFCFLFRCEVNFCHITKLYGDIMKL
jgi:hypothetical protein